MREHSYLGTELRSLTGLVLGCMVIMFTGAEARSELVSPVRHRVPTAASPAYCQAAHDVGRIALSVGNHGVLGTGLAVGGTNDCFTGEMLPSCQYPRGSQNRYLWSGAVWVGAVVGEDTLVSTGADGQLPGGNEFHPDSAPDGSLVYRSIIDPALPFYDEAVSEQDYLAVYSDTCTTCTGLTDDPADGRPHRPLNIRVSQRSYAWSYRETEDIVLFDYTLENTGGDYLHALYFGLYVDADVHSLTGNAALGYGDDHSGFLASAPHPLLAEDCSISVPINAAWTTDNDGDFDVPGSSEPIRGVFGICLLGDLGDSAAISFNWWHRDPGQIRDFGPQSRRAFRLSATGGLGAPVGDRDKYHLLTNGEVDYDQIRLATIGGTDSIWLPPSVETWPLAAGTDTRYLISVGPYELAPGATRQIALALTVGDDFHTIPAGSVYLPSDPDRYMENTDFGDLIENALTANYVFDNPGIDTDGDGYRGEFVECDGDTVWIRGDGVPDWRAALAPPAPELWIEPLAGGLRLRWNGTSSERTRHWLSGRPVFEGYAAYLGLDSTASAFSRVASYDIEDYRRYTWQASRSDWELADSRLTVEDAVCRYAPLGCDDQTWHPTDFTRQAPYIMPGSPDSVSYFEPVGPNAARLGVETPFVKIYPEAPYPPYGAPDQVPPDSTDVYLTGDGFFKFYEYEYIIESLLPGETYWATVTAYDCGSLVTRAVALESPLLDNAGYGVPLYSQPACCAGRVGDADCDNEAAADLADVVALIAYLFIDGPAPCCLAEGDLDQSGGVDPAPEDLTLGDAALLIDHLFINQQPLPVCL